MSTPTRTTPSSKEVTASKNADKSISEILSEKFPDEVKNLPAFKNLVKEAEANEIKRKKDSILREVLLIASERTKRPINTLSQFVSYFDGNSKKVKGGGRRAPRLTEDQKVKINVLRVEGKSLKEICEIAGVTSAQLNSFLYAKKKAE